MDGITEALLENSKAAIMGCIEIHNKPNFSYRYEVCTILAINGWELLLKAYINENCPDIRIIRKDNTSKPFLDCLSIVSSKTGKDFRPTDENLKRLYDFRCHIIHFYKDSLDSIIYSLLSMSVTFYNDFSKLHFNVDLTESSNLILLPIGFKPLLSPIDFLSNKSEIEKSSLFVQDFIKSIITSTETLHAEGLRDSIFSSFNMAVVNENRVKNADIIAGITKDSSESKLTVPNILSDVIITDDVNAKKIRIEEQSLFLTKYKLTYSDVVDDCRILYSDFKQNAKFNRIMSDLKSNDNYHKKRYLDIINKTGSGKDFYSSDIFNELEKHYTKTVTN